MKKTISINISEIMFNIDEDAYHKLYNYLKTIRGYFSSSDGRDEIMSDIESRIAEMLQPKVTDAKQVINIVDIDEVIAIMGEPEEYLDDEMREEREQRQSRSSRQTKRLYRDGEGNWLGGVCSGVGYYLGLDPLWIRLLLVFVLFASFGIGFLVYIALWIVIPEAATTAEKLEMKGEPVNVSNIGKTIEEELENIDVRFDRFTEGARNFDSRRYSKSAKNFFESLGDFILKVIKLVVQVFGKVLGGAFVIFGIVFIVFFILGLLGMSNSFFSFQQHFTNQELGLFFFQYESDLIFAAIGAFLFFGIPIMALIYGGLKLLLNFKAEFRGMGWIAAGLWFAGLVLLAFSGVRTARGFAFEDSVSETMALDSIPSDTVILNLGTNRFAKGPLRKRHLSRGEFVRIEDDRALISRPRVDIVRGEGPDFQVVLYRVSRGSSLQDARERASGIEYRLVQDGNELTFDRFSEIELSDQFRMQDLYIEVMVPNGKAVTLTDGMQQLTYDIGNVQDMYDHRMIGKTWTMTPEGLSCLTCETSD